MRDRDRPRGGRCPAGRRRMRIAVLHPQTSFVSGGGEIHTESLVRALREAGHDAEIVMIAGKWYPATELAHQMAVWRSFDMQRVERPARSTPSIALKFPAYLAPHERKIVWLIHQHRAAYELYDHPEFGDLTTAGGGSGGPRPDLAGRPRRARRGEADLHELAERQGPAVEHAADLRRGALPSVARSPRRCSRSEPGELRRLRRATRAVSSR